ncbi:hypothetical protein S245_008309, partial [Arachis hypogaea]
VGFWLKAKNTILISPTPLHHHIPTPVAQSQPPASSVYGFPLAPPPPLLRHHGFLSRAPLQPPPMQAQPPFVLFIDCTFSFSLYGLLEQSRPLYNMLLSPLLPLSDLLVSYKKILVWIEYLLVQLQSDESTWDEIDFEFLENHSGNRTFFRLILYVDGIPIRKFKNYESRNVLFSMKKPMR